ncbi:MAG: hypothetical protein ACFFBD_13870 [Candidatus Hodarchaeota archaeon]
MPICPKCLSYYVRAPCPVCAEQEGDTVSVSTGTPLGTSEFPAQPQEVDTQEVADVLDSTITAQADGYISSERVGLPDIPKEKSTAPRVLSAPMPSVTLSSNAAAAILSEINELKIVLREALQRLDRLEERISSRK